MEEEIILPPKNKNIIKLTRGFCCKIDDEDFDLVSKYKWASNINRRTVYAKTNIKDEFGKVKTISMHRLIMGNPINLQIDHINHNGLDNRKENLRICSSIENRFNCNSYKGSSSKYKGVSWDKNANKWSSKIRINKILKHLGCFKSEIEAARKYNTMASLHFGEYANLNNV